MVIKVYWYVEDVVDVVFVVEVVGEYEVEYVGVVGIGVGLYLGVEGLIVVGLVVGEW